MKWIIFSLITILSWTSFATGLPQRAEDVEIIKEKDVMTYENIPSIIKTFEGERNNTQTDELQGQCQQWVFKELAKREAPYFRVWCTRIKDVVLRQYRYDGNLLIRNC